MAGDSLGKLFVDLLLRDDGFNRDLKKAQGDIASFGSSVDELTKGIAQKFTVALEAAGAAILGLGAASAVMGAEFEQQITKVAVLAGAPVEALAVAARDFGASTKFSALEAAQAMESLAQAGLNTESIIGGTAAALGLAAASGSQLADATKIVATTMSQFQLTAADSTRISDVFTQALNKSQLDMEGLTLAMSYAGTVGSSFGMDLEETTAAVAMFSNLGLQGSKAGTAFRMSMSQAANVSKEAERALARYGLTAKDINPELHNFGQILDVVGRSGISASDAMVIFGTEVGGNVSALAQQSQDAGTRFKDTFAGMESALRSSAGVAATTADSMTKTVSGAWEEASGAFEEIMLSIYDTYSGPLRDLLLEVGTFLDELGVAFNREAGSLTEGFGGALESITAWLQENRNDLIVSIVDFTQGLAEVSQWLAGMIPYLDNIAALMAVVWVVAGVVEFATAVGSAYTAVAALATTGLPMVTAALATVGIELTALTGGLFAIVIAIGAVVAALVAYVSMTGDATLATERLTAAQEKQKQAALTASDEQIARMEALLAVQRDQAAAELASGAKLTAARAAELNQIVDMSAEQAALLVQQGKLVVSNGELRTAASLVEQAMDTAAPELLGDAYKELRGRQKDARAEAIALGEQLGLTAEQVARSTGVSTQDLEAMGYAAKGLRAEFEAGNVSAESYGAAIAVATGATDIATMEDAQIKFEALSKEVKQLDKAAVKFKGDAALAQRTMVTETERATGATRDQSRAVTDFSKTARDEAQRTADTEIKERQRAAQAAEADREQMRAETEKLWTGLQQQLADALSTDEEKKALARERELADIAATYQKQLALGGMSAAEEVATVERALAAQGLARSRYAVEDAAEAQARQDAASTARAAAEQKLADQLLQIRQAAMTESQRLESERADSMRKLDAELADQLAGIEGLSTAERAAAMEAFTQSSAAARAAIEEDYARRIGEAHKSEIKEAIAGPSELAKKWKDTREKLVSMIPEGFRIAFAHSMRAVKDFVSAMGKAFSAVGNTIGGIMQGALGALGNVTGFAFNLMDAVSEVQSTVADNASNGGSAAGASRTGGQQGAAQVAAGGVVGGMVTQAVDMVKTFAEAAPALISALAQQLPVLVQAIASYLPGALQAIIGAIPGLVQSVVTSLPVLIQAFVDALPGLIATVMQALPMIISSLLDGVVQLVTALIDSLPSVVSGFLAMIPGIITQLVTAVGGLVVHLIESIPTIVSTILLALPSIITSLIYGVVGAIPTIVLALVEAIPVIIISIIEAIPTIVMAVVNAIPFILTTVIGMIPTIISSLVAALPQILVALVMMIPTLIVQIIKAIPAIIKALVQGIVVDVILKIPQMTKELFKSIFASIGSLAKKFVELIKSALGLGGGKNKDKDKKDRGAYSGMEYVPAPMRVKVHQGEAILPADRNAQRLRGGPAAAGAGAAWGSGAGGGGGPIEIAVVAEGRLLEAVQMRAQAMGRASGMQRSIRRAAGVKVGFSRGSYTPWSK